MIVTTLGTSHGDATGVRFYSSTLIEAGRESVLVDAGAPVDALMVRAGKDIDALRAIAITHMHHDHVGGLDGLLKWILKHPTDEGVDLFLPEAGAIEALGDWLVAQHRRWPDPHIRAGVVQPGVFWQRGPWCITAEPTDHLKVQGQSVSYSLCIQREEKRVVCTGDLSADFHDFPDVARTEPCDLCICEVTHYDVAEAVEQMAAFPIKRLVVNHIADRWHGEGETELRRLLAKLPYPAEIARDGEEFEC